MKNIIIASTIARSKKGLKNFFANLQVSCKKGQFQKLEAGPAYRFTVTKAHTDSTTNALRPIGLVLAIHAIIRYICNIFGIKLTE